MTTCRDCAKDVEPFKCAHWTCACGAGIAVCFACDYAAYKVVDRFRARHLGLGEWAKECMGPQP